MKKKSIWALVVMLAAILLCATCSAEKPLPRVRFFMTEYVGHVGLTTNVLVDCLNPGNAAGKGEVFELRSGNRVLATAEWNDLSRRLTFRLQVDETMLGGHDLTIWYKGRQVSENGAYAAFSDLSVPRITRLEPSEPAIALTIVCGGGNSMMLDDILAVLDKYDVKCTFFFNGLYLEANVEDARRIVAAGHEIGSHGYQHVHMTQMRDFTVMRNVITRMNRITEELLGVRPRLFRAPYSDTNEYVTALARAEGMEDVMWNIDSQDWKEEHRGKPNAIYIRVTDWHLVNGSVIQFHLDGNHTAEVLDRAIPYYQDVCGYRVVTVGELMALSGRELPPLPENEQPEQAQ